MTEQENDIFTHATDIADRCHRHGRRLQAKEARSVTRALFSGLARAVVAPRRSRHGKAL